MEKTLLIFGMLILSFICFGQAPPISNLNISIGSNDKVFLTWNMPSGSDSYPMTMSWITSETNDGGCTQAGFDDIFGHLFNKSDLRNHIGWKIDTISFFKTTQWTYRICVWRQFSGEPMELVHNQLVQIDDSILDEWCAVALDTTIYIEENANYWFGVRATQEEGQVGPIFPIPFDKGPVVSGKGDLFMPDLAHWMSMQIGYNAMIKTTLTNELRVCRQSKEMGSLFGYRIYRDRELIQEIPYSFVTYFTDTEFTRETEMEYCVTAVYGDEESEPVCVTVTITGIEEAPEIDGITVLPNPTNGLVRIESVEAIEVQVYSAIGQLVKTVQNSNEIDMSHLTEGIYLLRITAKDGRKHIGKVTIRK